MNDIQQTIIDSLFVNNDFSADQECSRRVNFIANTLKNTRLKTLVLGISGGIDSTVAGRLCQLAVEQLRAENYEAEFIAVRLPYGTQKDEADAEAALAFIKADKVMIVNIKESCDQTLQALIAAGQKFADLAQEDFILGNIKARQRMLVQYAIAGSTKGLVVGTDHAAEALMGFFTKFGDGACDLAPLTGLNKRRVRKIAEFLNAKPALIYKTPTADLENLQPLRPDEDAYGVSYDQIDDFLEGKIIAEQALTVILKAYENSAHKRQLPVTPF